MYSEECSYEEFTENFGYRYVGDAQLYVKTNVSENNFSQIKTFKKPSESHFVTTKKVRFLPQTIKEKQKLTKHLFYFR